MSQHNAPEPSIQTDSGGQSEYEAHDSMGQPSYPDLEPVVAITSAYDPTLAFDSNMALPPMTPSSMPYVEPMQTFAFPTVLQGLQTDNIPTVKTTGKIAPPTDCQHRILAQQYQLAAHYWESVAHHTRIDLEMAQRTAASGLSMQSEMEALRQGQTVLRRGMARIETTLAAVLSGQGSVVRAPQTHLHQTEGVAYERKETQAANQHLYQDLNFIRSSLERGESEAGLSKVREMLSYMDRCSAIRNTALDLPENSRYWPSMNDHNGHSRSEELQ